MQMVCAKCSRSIEYSGERPSFCAYCGQVLANSAASTPLGFDPEGLTQVSASASLGEPALNAPAILGGYRLGRALGAGGMGSVYEAEELVSGRRVALKLIAPEYADAGDALDRFRQEGRIASMVSHPRCVFVLSVDEEAGQPYIVMELMPGSTLKDLVDRQGPLPPQQAIAKILDVIEGLQEAHRLEVIHRDVKPSNCFLEADGRVKVGDFGLAKSLVADAHLTKTGAFVGTPHFASPEQIKSEPIDQQTDVYSVAATLYFLLTGQAPFWGTDAAATLARIVADPAPSMRLLRPELSPALNRVVLRGLDRDRKRRWADLETFRQALLSLVPNRLSPAGMGLRGIAFAIDGMLLWLIYRVVLAVLPLFINSGSASGEAIILALGRGFGLALFVGYFTILEHAWGCSLGKGMFRLRVCTTRWIDPPGWGALAARAAVFFGLLLFGGVLSSLVQWIAAAQSQSLAEWRQTSGRIEMYFTWGWAAVGLAALGSTMRERNSYRGLHEFISGTRVAELPISKRRENLLQSGGWLLSFLQSRRLKQGLSQPSSLPERIAGFTIRGALKWSTADKVLLGEDSSLGRRVFIWLRPAGEPALEPARRDVGRRTRQRWLASGKQGDLQWDALLAPSGCPLPEFIHSEGKLDWRETRPLLEELAGELNAACADKTLPSILTVSQVWVQADGRAQLADVPLVATSPEEEGQARQSVEIRGLTLLRQVAALALEGKPRPLSGPALPSRASLPEKARRTIDRLLGIGAGYETVEKFHEDLANSEEE